MGEIDLATLRAPDRETVTYPHWLGTQRDYDPCFHEEANWERASELLEEECDALAQIDRLATDRESFDEIAFDEYEAEGSLIGRLELGVTGLVYALNAAGCVTASSCRGHPGQSSGIAWVLFSGSVQRVVLIAKLAQMSGVFVDNMEMGGVALLAPSVVEMVDLARHLLTSASAFAQMPQAVQARNDA